MLHQHNQVHIHYTLVPKFDENMIAILEHFGPCDVITNANNPS